MTVEKYAGPGSIRVDECILTNYDGSNELDIIGMVTEFSIYESIQKPFVTANFVIDDAISLLTQFPIIGQETLKLKFKTPGSAFLKVIDLELRVMSVTNFNRLNIREAQYVLNCATPAMIKDMNTKVRRSWMNVPIDLMAQDIVRDFLGGEIEEFSQTDGNRTIAIPNMMPSNALKFLAREAKSVDYKSSAYFFYETCDGFFFKTSDDMIKPERRTNRFAGKSIDKYYAADFDYSNPDMSPKEVINRSQSSRGYSGGSGYVSTKPFEHLKIKSFTFQNVGNYYNGMKRGYLENKIYFLDPVTSHYEEKVYKYMEENDVFKTTSQSFATNFLTENNDYISTGDSFVLFSPTNHTQLNDYPNDHKFDSLNYKIGSKTIFENVMATVMIPGDSDKRAGDVIDLEFPEFGASDDVESELNKFLSGEYLILSVRHIYTQEGYDTVMTVSKNAYEKRIESVTKIKSPSIVSESQG